MSGPPPARALGALVIVVVCGLASSGCGSLLYSCKAHDWQCHAARERADRVTAEVAIDVVAAGVEAAAHADDQAPETSDPPPPRVAAAPPSAPASPPESPPVSPPSPTVGAGGPPFPRDQALVAFHASVHRAKLCMGSSKGAVSGAMEFEPRGSVTVTALRGPGVLDPVVAGCVRTCLEQTPVSAFAGAPQTGHFTFDIAPDEASEER